MLNCCQEWRQHKAKANADEGGPDIIIISEDNANHLSNDVSNLKETEILKEAVIEESTVKIVQNTSE